MSAAKKESAGPGGGACPAVELSGVRCILDLLGKQRSEAPIRRVYGGRTRSGKRSAASARIPVGGPLNGRRPLARQVPPDRQPHATPRRPHRRQAHQARAEDGESVETTGPAVASDAAGAGNVTIRTNAPALGPTVALVRPLAKTPGDKTLHILVSQRTSGGPAVLRDLGSRRVDPT